jgi:hypothetical protein
MMGHPSLTMPTYGRIAPGTVVEHKYRLGYPMTIISGPVATECGERYIVRMVDGREERVLRKNLIL